MEAFYFNPHNLKKIIKMKWITVVLPIFTLLIGFVLAQFGDLFKERKEKKRKFKKLLFNLLSLHNIIKKDFNSLTFVEEYVPEVISKLRPEDRECAIRDLDILMPKLKLAFKNSFVEAEKVERLEKSIDSIIEDISEIYPIFAYELSEEYKIKDKLKSFEAYIESMRNQTNEEIPIELKNWLNSQITESIIEKMEYYIQSSAVSINKDTLRGVKVLLEKPIMNMEGKEKFMDDYLKEFYKKYHVN